MLRFDLQLFAKIIDDKSKKAVPATVPNTENSTTTPTQTNLKGVDSSLVNTINSKFTESDSLLSQKQDVTDNAKAYKDFASNTNIIDSKTKAGMSTPYSKSGAVLQAEQILQDKINKGYAGTYKDELNNIITAFMNREDFEYDVDKDQMFQQALASAMGSGKTAMQDTMGQAAALTGGYGSTYATTAGNQAYNAFIEDAYNNLPEYYNMALAAYEAEGQQMLQQYNMLDAADTKEYNQWYDDINLQYQQTRDMVNDEYNQWNANQTMFANIANMQLAENAQIGNNLYNSYNISSNEYENSYAKEWQSWQQSVENAFNLAGMQSNDYWNTEDMNFRKSEAERDQANWQKQYELELAAAGAPKDKNGNIVVPEKKGSTLTNTELEKAKEIFITSGGSYEQVDNYLSTIGKNDLDDETNTTLRTVLKDSSPEFQDWTISTDTYNGGWFFGTNWLGGGNDWNDVYTNGTTTKTFKELKKAIEDSNLSDEEKKKRIKALKDQSKK